MKTALYPGSFDPITNGHVSLIERGLCVFDQIIVGVASNNAKTPLFSVEERVELAKVAFAHNSRVVIEPFSGLTVTYARRMNVVAILRGLRAISDFEYEFQLALMNRRLERNIQTVFLMTDYKWLYTSSTLIKSAIKDGADIKGLVPEHVRQALIEKFALADMRDD